LRVNLYDVAFALANEAGMAEQLKWFEGRPSDESTKLSLESDTEAYVGHVGKARELVLQSVDAARRNDDKETGSVNLAAFAVQQAAYGNIAAARDFAAQAMKLSPESPGTIVAALAFAMAGDTVQAESIARAHDKRFPLNTLLHFLWLPTIQAQLALDRKNAAHALDALRADSPMDLGLMQFCNNTSCLYSIYIRGQAYLAAGQGNEAAGEFRRILDHSGIYGNCWTGALAQLGLARSYALEAGIGNLKTASSAVQSSAADRDAARTRALAAYKDFLALWKDADRDIPILKEAQAEYAKL